MKYEVILDVLDNKQNYQSKPFEVEAENIEEAKKKAVEFAYSREGGERNILPFVEGSHVVFIKDVLIAEK